MTSQYGKQAIAMHTMPNISKTKGNQTTKFGQVIECNIFLDILNKMWWKNYSQTLF